MVLSTNAAENLLKCREVLRTFWTIQPVAKQSQEYLRKLQDLNVTNGVIVSGMCALRHTHYEALIRALVWGVSAYTDWLQTEIVTVSDVQAAVEMLTQHSRLSEDQTFDMWNEKSLISSFPADVQTKLLQELYDVFITNDLYVSEMVLKKVAIFITNVLHIQHEDVLQALLYQAKYWVKLEPATCL